MATGNPDFDSLLSTTLANYRDKFTDNVFVDLPLLYWLKEADHIEKEDGGESLVEQLLYGQNDTFQSYAGYENVDTSPQEGHTAAVYPWRQLAVTVAISGIEEAKNHGEARLINLLKAKIEQAEMSASDGLNAMLHGDGTGNSNKDWLGLEHFIPDDPTSGSVGNIDRSDSSNAWWRPYVSTTTTALTISSMSTAYNTVSRGGGKDHPDWILTTQGLWEKYESLLQPQLRYSDPKSADAGFQNLLYRSAPVVWDGDCTSTNMYFLNSKYVKLKVHSQKWFKATAFQSPIGGDAKYSTIYSYGNLVVRNSKRLGKLTNRS